MTIFYNKSKNEFRIILFYTALISFSGIVILFYFFSNSFDRAAKIVLTLTSLVAVIGTYICANSNE